MNKITFHGHSFVELNINNSVIYIDPFIEGNPLCDIKSADAKCDYIILIFTDMRIISVTL